MRASADAPATGRWIRVYSEVNPHHETHELGGVDEVKIENLATDVYNPSSSSSSPGPGDPIQVLVPDGGGTWLLPRLVGLARAKEMIFTGRNVGAREAEKIGLINYAVKAEELDEFVKRFARKLAKGPSEAIAASKRAIHASLGFDMAEALKLEAETQIEMFKTDKHKRRVRAFLRAQK